VKKLVSVAEFQPRYAVPNAPVAIEPLVPSPQEGLPSRESPINTSFEVPEAVGFGLGATKVIPDANVYGLTDPGTR
jgi:hypothetical protein